MTRLFPAFLALLLFPLPAGAYAPHADVVAGPVRGAVTEVIDGDTVEVRLHVWIGEDIVTRVRIAGIDAPELHGKCASERSRAAAAKAEMERLLSGGGIVLTGIRLEKYAGRVLAHAAAADGTDVATHMLENNFARPYHGEKRGGWCGVSRS